MKIKVLCVVFSVLMAAGLMAGCGGNGEPQTTNSPTNVPVSHDVAALAQSIYENCQFEDSSLAKIEDRDFIPTFYGIDAAAIAEKDGVKQISAYVASASPEMIIALKAVDSKSAGDIYNSSIKPFIASYIEGYSDYGPDQVPKLESAVVHIQGQYLVIVVSANNTFARDYVGGLMG